MFNYPIAISLSPNTQNDDVWQAFKTLLSPWRFREGNAVYFVKQWFKKYFGVNDVYLFNSGRSALYTLLKALEIGEGDEVLIQAFTCIAVPDPVIWTGAKTIFVDIDDSLNIDPEAIERHINHKTRAIIVQHTFGIPAQISTITKIAQKHNLIIIEDAAQALGAKFKNKMAGSFGLAGGFSLYPFKVLGCFGDGGILTTNDEKLAEKIRLLRDHGQKTKTEIVCFGWNSRLDNLQAAILNVKFNYLPEWIKKRREIAKIYNQGLFDISEIKLPPAPGSDERYFDIYQNYVLKAQKRDELYNYLKERGVETLIKDPIPNHWHKNLGLSHFKLPYTERLAKEVISLPMYPELTNGQIEYVINCVKEFYQG